MSIQRREVVTGLISAAAVAAMPVKAASADDELIADISEMLMIGFSGRLPQSDSLLTVCKHIARGSVGSVIFISRNVGSRSDFLQIVQSLQQSGRRPLLAIDHEGGLVQRLKPAQGFTELPSAKRVASEMDVAAAGALYARGANELAAAGIQLNLGPVVDLHVPGNLAIARYSRAFDAEPEKVTAYADAFIGAFASANVACALKHFPGHGHSTGDSHDELPDIKETWSRSELTPYIDLIARHRVRVIMAGHLHWSDDNPATLSPQVITTMLRNEIGFRGVIMTDDIDMVAIRNRFPRGDAFVRAIAAGNDLIMIRNETAYDPDLPSHAVQWVTAAIERGELDRAQIRTSANRVRSLRDAIYTRSLAQQDNP